MRKVKVGKFFAVVDDADYSMVSRHTWYPHNAKRSGGNLVVYARTNIRRNPLNPKNGFRGVMMHKLIMGDGVPEIDHRDGDGLNNQRHNLRPCSHSQNIANTKVCRSSTGYKGVYYSPDSAIRPYKAILGVHRKLIHLGRFATPQEAALAYNEAAVRFHGEFASLNNV